MSILTQDTETMVLRTMVATLIGFSLMVGAVLVIAGAPSGASPAMEQKTVYVYDNNTVFVNTTNSQTVNHYDNSTTTVYNNVTHQTTVYVNTTFIEEMPVVVVTSITVDFANGTSEVVATPSNYSLPVGVVTYVQFSVGNDGTTASVNSPWVLLSYTATPSDRLSPACGGQETATALIGVPMTPGSYAMVISVA